MAAAIPVDMGQIEVSNRRTDNLRAVGLGACVGVCLFDPIAGVAGMVHVVLPSTPPPSPPVGNKRPILPLPGKCADTAISAILAELEKCGAVQSRLRAALVGGAQIFTPAPTAGGAAPISRLEIGPRNVEAVRKWLTSAKVPIVAEQVGGHSGRTCTLEVATGRVYVRPIGSEERLLVGLADAYMASRGKEVAYGR